MAVITSIVQLVITSSYCLNNLFQLSTCLYYLIIIKSKKMTTEKNVTPVVTKTTEQTTVLSLTNMPKFNNAAEEYAWLKAYEKQTKDRRDAEKKAEKQLKERQKEIEAAAAAEALKQDIAIFQAKDTNVQVNIRWTPKNGFPDGRKEGYKTLKPEMSEAIAAAISQVLKAYFSDPF